MAGEHSAPATAYGLRAELKGHVEDVRGCVSCELGIITASRDKTVRLWAEQGPREFTCVTTFVGHADYVTALAYLPAGSSPFSQQPCIASGSRDTKVIVWDVSSAQAVQTLAGHTYQVTGVAALRDGSLASGALDKTVRLWAGTGKCVAVLEGHTGPVLSLAALDDGSVLSGSGDGTIKRWAGGRCVHTYSGHTDTVRGLAVLPDGLGFVSGSHDMTCKVWSLDGSVLSELLGHTALVYAVAATANGRIASGSEDNTARVWSLQGQCLQVIEHVACVWAVAFTASRELVTGSGDSVARVWSTHAQHQAPAEVAAAFHETVASAKAQRTAAAASSNSAAGGAGGADVPGLPPGVKVEPASSLLMPGAKDGVTRVVREADGAVWAYSWDATAGKWEKIGEVVPPPSGAGGIKKLHNGQEWDFVFDVDIQEGAPPLKLAMNRDDNPYLVADAFVEAHGLPTYFKEQARPAL